MESFRQLKRNYNFTTLRMLEKIADILLSCCKKPASTPLPEDHAHSKLSYAQEGEDILIDRIVSSKLKLSDRPGYFIDVGAHHPYKFSNTYRLYQQGWSGLNIDANAEAIELFKQKRPRDLSICAVISDTEGEQDLHVFSEHALTTLDPSLAKLYSKSGYAYHTEKVRAVPFKKILRQHLPQGQEVDILNIDIEGIDEEVLQDNDWEICNPKLILIELIGIELDQISSRPIHLALKERGYSLISKTLNTFFYINPSLCGTPLT